MRIGFVISSLRAGGAERVLSTLANGLAKQGYDVTIFCFMASTDVIFYPLSDSVRVIQLGLTNPSRGIVSAVRNNIHRIVNLHKSIQLNMPDVLVSFMDMTNILTILSSVQLDIPVIVCEHTNPNRKHLPWIWRVLRRICYPYASTLVLLTEEFRTFYQSMMKYKITIIPNPVDPPVVDRMAGNREETSYKTILAVGRLIPLKGFDLLINAFGVIANNHPQWNLVILGEGSLRSDLETTIKKQGLENRVFLPGLVKNPYEYMAKADIFVSSSLVEGFPMVICEAMMSKLPVIASNSSAGVREILNDGESGILIETNNLNELVASLEEMIVSEKRREVFAKKGYDFIQRYKLENVLPKWERLFDSLVKKY